MKLKGKVAIVTGGGTGIGSAIAQLLANEGAVVVINYHKSVSEAEKTANEIKNADGEVLLIQADITQDSESRLLIDQTLSHLGRVDILINNAGITFPVKFNDLESLTEQMWDDIYAVNVKGAFFCSRAASVPMKKQGDGCIINVSSASGFNGRGSSIAYTASKAALISLTKSLSLALAPDIRVNSVAPGFVPTRWHEGHESWHPGIIKETPLGRLAQPEDIARLVTALVCDAPFVTGQTVICDGGVTYQ